MTYEQFAKERDAYFSIALPTDADFTRYTQVFFAWLDDLNLRVANKWPGLVHKREPLSLFDNDETDNKRNTSK